VSNISKTELEKITRSLKMIRDDIVADVDRREGMALTGPNMAAALGEICAQIDGVAHCVEVLVRELYPN